MAQYIDSYQTKNALTILVDSITELQMLENRIRAIEDRLNISVKENENLREQIQKIQLQYQIC